MMRKQRMNKKIFLLAGVVMIAGAAGVWSFVHVDGKSKEADSYSETSGVAFGSVTAESDTTDISDTAEVEDITTVTTEEAIENEVPEPIHDTPDISDLDYPFNVMSADWGEDSLEGWWHYELPEDYKRTGGYLPDIVQVYTYCLCQQYGLDYAMVLAIIEVESGYRYDAVSVDGGIGYMQVIYRWHYDRMDGMTESDLYNPYINISVALDYLRELSGRYKTMDEVLTAYNYGASGAYENFWRYGVCNSPYSDKVLETRAEILEKLEQRQAEVTAESVGGAQ